MDTLSLTSSALMPVSPRPDAVMVRGRGSYLWDTEGRRYLDFVQGWAVNCLGHCPEVVTQALVEQAGKLLNASPAFHTEPQHALAGELTQRAGLHHAFFCATGAEANEGAIKLARRWGTLHRDGAFELITTHGSFHGRTLATMAASGKPGFDALFPPKIEGFVKVPYGDVDAVARAIGPRTAAVMVEPIQGEAGVVVPQAGYLRALRELTRAQGVLLILDEVQTGMGRTGTLFACEHEGVVPDIMTLGKGLGGGVPLAALLASREASCFQPGDQGGTFSGHPLTTAVGLAVLRALCAEGMQLQVQQAGARLEQGLNALGRRLGADPARGRGLLWALPLPAPVGPEVVRVAFARGLLINSPQPTLLRFMPSLLVSDEEIDAMLALLSAALDEVLP